MTDTRPTCASLFSGFGGFDLGAHAAGFRSVYGLDMNPDVVGVARANGLPFTAGDVRHVNWSAVPDADLWHASPECTRVSTANAKASESEVDTLQADAVVAMLRAKRPPFFTLENVRQYEGTESLGRILAQLDALGYRHQRRVLNSADHGVPQTRKRLILAASRDGAARLPDATHTKGGRSGLFGGLLPWNGWHDAVEDLLADLPDTDLAAWQMKRLPDEWKTLLVGQGGYDGRIATRGPGDPALTVTANTNQGMLRATLVSSQSVDGGAPALRDGECPALTVDTKAERVRALLCDGRNASTMFGYTTREDVEPSFTAVAARTRGDLPRAVLVGDQRRQYADGEGRAFTVTANGNGGTSPRAVLTARTVRLSPRCLARFQSFPDSYVLPEKVGLACLGIGNAVPPVLAAAFVRTLTEG